MSQWSHDITAAPRGEEKKTEIPEDVLQAARTALAAEYERDYPTYKNSALEGNGSFTLCSINAIAKSIMAERNRCADLAKYYALACINAGYSEEASGAGYYACSQVEGEIRNPENHKPKPSVEIDEDDLPF